MAAVGAVAGLIGQLLAQRKLKGNARTKAYNGPMARRPFKGRKVPMPYAGKRSYPKNKALVKNDGSGNQRMAAAHGKRLRPLKPSMQKKVFTSLQPVDCQLIDYSAQTLSAVNQCKYSVYELGNTYDIDQLIVNANTTGGSGVPVDTNGKIFIKDMSMELTLTNCTNTTVDMQIYEYVARKDLPPGLSSTAAAVVNGFGQQATAQITATSIGSTLFNNPLFCAYYKIVKVRNVQLALGKTLKLSLRSDKGKIINPMVWSNSGDEITEQGFTRGYVIRYQGQPANQNGVSGTPGVTIAEVDAVWSNRYHFQSGYDVAGRNFFSSSTFGTVPTGLINPAGAVDTVKQV